MSDEEDSCPHCYHGKLFLHVGEGVRRELSCPYCDGAGTRSQALARLLAGESMARENLSFDQQRALWSKAHS